MMNLLFHLVGWTLFLTILCLLPLKLWCKIRKRRTSRIMNRVLLGAVILLPIMSQSQYMFLDEPLVDAARNGDYAQVKALLLLGANINCEADDGRGTALLAAIQGEHRDIVRLLVDRGANVNQAADASFTHGNETPLQAAAGQTDVIALLRRAGAKQ